jgi:hypothetical protein
MNISFIYFHPNILIVIPSMLPNILTGGGGHYKREDERLIVKLNLKRTAYDDMADSCEQ